MVIAYEPVWAIGTGLTATPEDAQNTHAGVRKLFSEQASPEVAEAVRIQYGGWPVRRMPQSSLESGRGSPKALSITAPIGC